jgi:beta-glucuronidase
MVMDLKDEPYILMWLLGNENNYGVANNADKDPVAYYKFVNDVAKMIHEIDPDHPVAICSGDTLFLDLFAKNAPEVDVFGANVYRGDYGFGSFWEQVSGATGKPAFITEYGSPAYTTHLSLDDGEIEQANYHRGNWLDIESNLGGHPEGIGNALGGVAFEWLDEWWKNYEPYRHDKKSEAIGPFAGGYYFEEWFGLNAQGKGKHSPFLRQPRKVFGVYKEMWKSKP